jgi:hypothetical protein
VKLSIGLTVEQLAADKQLCRWVIARRVRARGPGHSFVYLQIDP